MADPAPVSVRLATAADVEAFVDQRIALFRETQDLRDGTATERLTADTRAVFARFVDGGSTWVWLAVQPDGAAAGSAVLHAFERFPSLTNTCAAEGYVAHVYVAPPWRRRGVGTALLDALIAGARAQGLQRIRLHATEPGRALYETLGFRLRSNDMELLVQRVPTGGALPRT